MPDEDDRFDTAAREDGAVFVPARVRGSRGPRLLATLVVVAVGGMIAVGALDREPARGAASVAGATADSAVVANDHTPTSTPRTARTELPSNRFTNDPIVQPIGFDVRSAGSHLFIHGDVFSLAVSRVLVKLEDLTGHVADTRSVDVPGGSTAFRLGAVSRFDVHFFLPDEVQADGFVVSATALDSAGHRLTTVEERILRAAVPM